MRQLDLFGRLPLVQGVALLELYMGLSQYAFAYNILVEETEIGFRFPGLPQIMAFYDRAEVASLSARQLDRRLHDAVITALQALVSCRGEIPEADRPDVVKADGFVFLSSLEAMKLELYRLYVANCDSVISFADQIGKKETAARRLLNLRHRSWPSEIEAAIEALGKRLVHSWATDLPIGRPVRDDLDEFV